MALSQIGMRPGDERQEGVQAAGRQAPSCMLIARESLPGSGAGFASGVRVTSGQAPSRSPIPVEPTPGGVGFTSSFATRTTRDVDEHATAVGAWQQRYHQIAPGRFTGEVVEAWLDGIQLFRERTSEPLYEEGSAWPNAVAIALLVRPEGPVRWQAMQWGASSALILRRGEEMRFRTTARLDVAALALEEEELERYGVEVEGRDPALLLGTRDGMRLGAPEADRIIGVLGRGLAEIAARPDQLARAEMRRALRDDILQALVAALPRNEPDERTPALGARRRIADRARAHILDHVDEALTIADLCAALRVSRRSLQYSFNDVFGISPVKYLKIVRLNGARRDLRNAGSGFGLVQDVAARWGFWHLSHFAEDYRRLFLETPSRTLGMRRRDG